ncbi:unnamed protein product [Nesidiocoris tenuis]|uniref:Uncharacterized protein n=1 Tax=Nesidiocoris tenuis TaxID=355587 RepID=A0A6H5HRI3_9HEMI|nr:unnamed protein product [Nesidiocoris tenuis]CAB0021140.1 unnamed protein product [Nesidiocoris tenuis]
MQNFLSFGLESLVGVPGWCRYLVAPLRVSILLRDPSRCRDETAASTSSFSSSLAVLHPGRDRVRVRFGLHCGDFNDLFVKIGEVLPRYSLIRPFLSVVVSSVIFKAYLSFIWHSSAKKLKKPLVVDQKFVFVLRQPRLPSTRDFLDALSIRTHAAGRRFVNHLSN